jgi:hypothetical protein
MLIKYMSVEIGKSQFILHITTIENIKKSKKLDHNGYVIDAGGTRAALKDILSTTKKNLKRRTALVEIGRGSSSARSSKRKRTKKNYSTSSTSSLLRSKKSSGKSNKSRSHSGIANEDDSSMDDLDIGNSKESIKSLARTKKEPSNKLSSMIDLKSMKLSSKQSKPSIYKRPSEKRPAPAAAPALPAPGHAPAQPQRPAGIPLAPGAMPPAPLTGDFAGKKQEILGGPAPSAVFSPLPGQQPAQPQYQPAQPQQQKYKPCKENTDATSCQADPTCFWNASKQYCGYNKQQQGYGPGAAPGVPNPFGAAPGAAQPGIVFPAPAAAPLSPPPMIEAI